MMMHLRLLGFHMGEEGGSDIVSPEVFGIGGHLCRGFVSADAALLTADAATVALFKEVRKDVSVGEAYLPSTVPLCRTVRRSWPFCPRAVRTR